MKSYVVALLVVVGILAGFYGGYKFGQNNVSANTTTRSSLSRAGSAGNAGNAGAFTGGRGLGAVCPSPGAPTPATGSQALARGSVTDLASSSLTVTNTNCDVKVTFGPTVTITKTVAGSTSDLQDNQTVTITGTRRADGSIQATTIVIGGGGFRIGGGAGAGAGSAAGSGG